MKKNFENLTIEIVLLDKQDIITNSFENELPLMPIFE